MAIRFSTGCCNHYEGFIHPLGGSIEAGRHVRYWYTWAGLQLFTAWNDTNVWRSDFKDAGGGDLASDGGSDVPEIYFFQGHGDGGQIYISNGGVDLWSDSVWGNGQGKLQLLILIACSTMPLDQLGKWFPCFRGLHLAVGNSTRVADGISRGVNLVAYTSGMGKYAPGMSVGDAWMRTGLVDAEEGCSAVVIAGGTNRADAEDRRDHERIKDNRPKPHTTWISWRWVTKPF